MGRTVKEVRSQGSEPARASRARRSASLSIHSFSRRADQPLSVHHGAVLAVSRPANPRLGSVPNHHSHGPRRRPAALRHAAAGLRAQEAAARADTRATRNAPLANPAHDRVQVARAARALPVDLVLPAGRVRRWDVPQGRPAEARRAERGQEPSRGDERPRANGGHDGRHEEADGHDGPADGHHGLDQLFLPGLCPHQAPVPADEWLQEHAAAWDRHAGHGRALGVLAQLVHPQPVRPQRRLPYYPGQRKLGGLLARLGEQPVRWRGDRSRTDRAGHAQALPGREGQPRACRRAVRLGMRRRRDARARKVRQASQA